MRSDSPDAASALEGKGLNSSLGAALLRFRRGSSLRAVILLHQVWQKTVSKPMYSGKKD